MAQDRDDGVVWISHGAEQTRRAGEALGRACRGGEVIVLEGPLGAGKTVLAQGVALGLGIQEPVTSPTFTILKEYNGRQEYNGRLALAHFDFYRVDETRPVDVEFDDYVGGHGVCVMEWASRVSQVVPPEHILVELHYAGDAGEPELRLVRASAAGPRHIGLLRDWQPMLSQEPDQVDPGSAEGAMTAPGA